MENSPQKTTIKNWSESDRPREKLLLKGKTALSDAELIAILIGSGSRDESAVELSKRILKMCDDSLIELSLMTLNDLQKFKGIGEAKAITIAAALELGRRRRGAEVMEKKTIRTSREAYEIIQMHLGDSLYEQFIVLFLNRSHQIIKAQIISEGGITGTVADPKKIFRLAFDCNAVSIVLGHNHPSGSVKPSSHDIDLTKKIKRAGESLEIAVLDHIIVGSEVYYSFADEGIM